MVIRIGDREYRPRKLGLGKLIGERTWGGLVGYSGTPTLVDGGGQAQVSRSGSADHRPRLA